jgi:hypothetical protein
VRIYGGEILQFEGSVITEQGVKFAIVVVKEHVLNNQNETDRMISAFQRQVFPGIPVVLMAQDSRGTPKYRGRRDIVNFLANIDIGRIPWKKYTLS